MHFISFILSSLLALSVSAVPTPDSTTTTIATSPIVFNIPTVMHLKTREVTGLIRLYTNFDAGSRYADVTIPSSTITTSPLAQGFSAFKVNSS